MTASHVIPTPEQMAAIVDIASTGRRVTRLHGYAGTGKTSVVATEAIRALERQGVSVQVLAPTGKAAKVLRSKGLHGAATIHSYLYTPSKRERTTWREAWESVSAAVAQRRPELGPLLVEIDAATADTNVSAVWDALLDAAPSKLAARLQSVRDERRFELAFTAAGAIAFYEDYGVPAAEVLLIDEASMVSRAVSDDLERTGSRLIFVGDPAQLPPVRAQRSDAAMGAAHHLLTEVHRQKGGSPVLKLATEIRKSPTLLIPPTKSKNLLPLHAYDQVLCWRNATREHVNAEVRRLRGYRRGTTPAPGDRLVCLKNTKPDPDGAKQWMNGEQATVLAVDELVRDETLALTVRDDEGAEHEVASPLSTFGGHRAEQAYLDGAAWRSPDPAFAFGYALTVHKAQGSEWASVLLVDESADMVSLTSKREGRAAALDQARQWAYTGVTRAAERLDVVRTLRDVARRS